MREGKSTVNRRVLQGKPCWDSTMFYPTVRGQLISIKGQRQRKQKQKRTMAWGCQCQRKDAREWRFLSSENAASQERRLHPKTMVTCGEHRSPCGPQLQPGGETLAVEEEVPQAGLRLKKKKKKNKRQKFMNAITSTLLCFQNRVSGTSLSTSSYPAPSGSTGPLRDALSLQLGCLVSLNKRMWRRVFQSSHPQQSSHPLPPGWTILAPVHMAPVHVDTPESRTSTSCRAPSPGTEVIRHVFSAPEVMFICLLNSANQNGLGCDLPSHRYVILPYCFYDQERLQAQQPYYVPANSCPN